MASKCEGKDCESTDTTPCPLCGMVLCESCAEADESPGGFTTCCEEMAARAAVMDLYTKLRGGR